MSTIACSNMNAFCMQEYESKVVQHPTFNRIEHLSSWFTKLKYSTIQAKSNQNNVLRLVRQPAHQHAPPSPTQPSKSAHLTTCTLPTCKLAHQHMHATRRSE